MNASRRPMLLAALLALAPSLMSQKVEPASRKSPQKQKSKEAAERRALAVSIRRGLKWLRDHQEPDGRWRALGFPELCPEGDHCKGRGNATNDIGVTGLAILAIAGSARSGPYESVAKAGVAWLQSQMSGPGLIGKQAGLTFMYNHAIATFALLEAQRLLRFEEPVSAKRAIDYILRARNPYKVWRYHPHSGENDTSVTGWMVLALTIAFGALRCAGSPPRSGPEWRSTRTRSSTRQPGSRRSRTSPPAAAATPARSRDPRGRKAQSRSSRPRRPRP
ncbi:MAG: prenyltransferase/squalene oxidase repeat-containing protein [Planctomycetota bacterium]